MQITGEQFIAGKSSREGHRAFRAVNPAASEPFGPEFADATTGEIDRALEAARAAFEDAPRPGFEQTARFLESIASELLALGDHLIDLASQETGLGRDRLIGERARTVGQLRMFAQVVRDGSWVDARIDHADPNRKPLPKPDVRRMRVPIGPVVVFGASNFPIAFSVAGGDTASALAAGNPVVFKAHPAHPQTSELIARAALRAAEAEGMPAGTFSLIQGVGHEPGIELVRHRLAEAVAFTGSLRGGRALFDAAVTRSKPIPFFGEMGSINPVFLLPGALAERTDTIARGLIQSATLGAGQFCTNPGIVLGLKGAALDRLTQAAADLMRQTAPQTMLYAGIRDAFIRNAERMVSVAGVRVEGHAPAGNTSKTHAPGIFLSTDASTFLAHLLLQEECFGPSTLLVRCDDAVELEAVARALEGQLTASIHGTPDDLKQHDGLVRILQRKAGRILFNGFPTGVEVCSAMQHGGPYPATSNAHFTSVGSAAIERFARPVCFQDFPPAALPPELQDANPRQIWRLVNDRLTKE